MMRVFAEDGAHVPCTVLDLEGCQVIGRRTVDAEEFKNAAGEAVALKPKKSRKNEKKAPPAREAKGDGYTALQLGAGAAKAKNKSQADRGQFARANFTRARLDEADFSGADLRGARGLTQAQLNAACGNAETRLPRGLRVPECD